MNEIHFTESKLYSTMRWNLYFGQILGSSLHIGPNQHFLSLTIRFYAILMTLFKIVILIMPTTHLSLNEGL